MKIYKGKARNASEVIVLTQVAFEAIIETLALAVVVAMVLAPMLAFLIKVNP